MTTRLNARKHSWPLREPFAIARGTQTECDVVIVELSRGPHTGRGEAAGVPYHGETPESILAQIESIRPQVEAGIDRKALSSTLPAGGARNALDCALWDLEARSSGVSAWAKANVQPHQVTSCITIGIRSLEEYARRARELAEYPWLKIKVAGDGVVPIVEAIRREAPRSKLVVDANQAWTIGTLRQTAPELARLGVSLIEQPLRAGEDGALDGYESPVPICADESIDESEDLRRLRGRYQYINIKLDKTGGLTAALDLAERARAENFQLMVGCMLGSSLAMAPAMLVAQYCAVVDLDGPLLQASDCEHPIRYRNGVMDPPSPRLWGGGDR